MMTRVSHPQIFADADRIQDYCAHTGVASDLLLMDTARHDAARVALGMASDAVIEAVLCINMQMRDGAL